MSLTSWALVVAHHRERDNLRAGYIYLLMAGFGTLALLLAFGLLAGNNGNYLFDRFVSRSRDAVAAIVLAFALSAPDPRRVLFRFMPGCRSPIRLRPVTRRR